MRKTPNAVNTSEKGKEGGTVEGGREEERGERYVAFNLDCLIESEGLSNLRAVTYTVSVVIV